VTNSFILGQTLQT